MTDDAPLTPRQIATLFANADWKKLMPFLLTVAYRLIERDDEDAANDLVSEAVDRVWAGINTGKGRRWDPRKHSLKKYMAWVVVSVFRNKLASHYEQLRVYPEEGKEYVAVEPTGHAGRVLVDRERIEKGDQRIVDTRARLDGLSLLVFDEIIAGTYRPAVFAAAHDVSIDEAHAARQLAKYHWKAVLEDSPDSSGPISAAMAAAAGVDDEEEGGQS